MAYVNFNPNPQRKLVGDCVIRAISKATDKSWEEVFLDVMQNAFELHDMPSSNYVWADYLIKQGFHKYIIPDTCPACYTVFQFAQDHPKGTYILGTGTHVVTVQDGNYFDSWDSGNEVPIYYFHKEG